MKTLYLECAMGASGNMLLGALLDLLPEPETWLSRLGGLGLPGVRYACARTGGPIAGNLVTVTVHGRDEDAPHHGHPHDHPHGEGLDGILRRIAALPVSPAVRDRSAAVYRAIAEAEAKVHGRAPDEVHFHEVGSLDAVADVVGVCLLLEALGPDRVLASPVHAGCGTVRCAHGLLPVPAPATAELLRGVPWYGGAVQGELCTPTGAALLRTVVSDFGPLPPLRTARIGYGFGSRQFDRPNCLRAFLGETDDAPADEVYEIRCNLDDCTGEDLAFARERLEELGALDVTVLPAMMKKNRPGFLLCCLCRPADLPRVTETLLRHTTTGGVRYAPWRRTVLETSVTERETPYGPVREKRYRGSGIDKRKPEYEDLAAAARRAGVPLQAVRDALRHEN